MKKKSLLVTILLLLIAVFAFSLTACNNEVGTLESIKNEYGIVVDGGSFEEGSTLVSNEIVATTEEAAEVLAAIADQNYNKDGSIYIFDIYVTKDGKEVQPDGKVKVSVPVPNVEVDNYLVFHVKSDNSVESLVPTVADGKISFEVSSFSYFVIAEVAPVEHEHNYESAVTPPTCTEDGYTTYTCACGNSYVGDTVTAPGHTYVDGKCECGADDPNYTPPHVHSYEWVEEKASTCKEEGIAPHYHCDGCGKNFNPNYGEMETISIPKAEHEYGSLYWGKSANFFEDGNIEYYQCSECEKYFDKEYNEVETPVIPKYSTNISICVNGTPTVLVLGEHNDSFIEWSLEGLSVTKDDVITLCQTDATDKVYDYFAEGNVGTDGKILTTAAAANVLLTATPNGLMLFIDGYKYEGIVIEINGVQYPMNYVTYSDEQTTGYIYGLVNFAEGDKFVVVDNVSGTVYDYDDLCATYNWNTWDFHRGDNGEFVIDNAGRYGIEFDGDVTKEIYINKHFAPLDGGSYEVVIEGEEQGVSMQQTKIPEGSEAYDGVLWYYKHDSMMNVDDILAYIEEKGLYTYTASVTLAAGSKLNIKNLSVNTVITADHLTEVYANDACLTKEGDYVKFLSDGVYFITYLPAYNAFSIRKSEEELPDAYIYCDNSFVALTKDASNVVTYEGLVAGANDYITFFDGTKTRYLSITLDNSTDSTIAHVVTSEGLDMLFFDKAGTYNLAYNIDTGVLSITSVGGDTDQGGDGEQGGSESIDDYIIFISVIDYTNGNQTLYPTKNPANPKEVYIRVETIAANSYLSVSAMSKADHSSTTYGTLADTDASVATNLTADIICVKVAGPIDVYFNFETKTVKIVAVSGSTEETVLPKDIYISEMKKYAFIENPDNSDELCYLGLVLESYDDFRIRDTDNNYITDITLASGTTGVYTNGSSVMVQADGTYNIYINKTTHEVRIVVVS